jgi:hypothetical protein
MDMLPVQGVTYPPQDTVCFACAQDIWVMLEYRDAVGVVGQRWMCRGTWPLTTSALLGYRYRDGVTGQPSALQDLDTLATGQFTVGRTRLAD